MTPTIRSLIVDDEKENRSILRHLLGKYSPDIVVIGEADTAQSAQQMIEQFKPDLVFLDISLPPSNAFEMLKNLQRIDFLIIFVTAHHDYALQAFQYSAVSYVLKPIEENLFLSALEQVRHVFSVQHAAKMYQTLFHNLSLTSPRDVKVCLPTLEGFDVLQVSDLLYCIAESNYTFVHSSNKQSICVSKTLSQIEEMLPRNLFFRIHKSHIVNLNHVRKYIKNDGGMVVMADGKSLEVSRRKKTDLLAILQGENL